MTKRLMKRFALSEEGAKGLVWAVAACTIANLGLMLPVGLLYLLAEKLRRLPLSFFRQKGPG